MNNEAEDESFASPKREDVIQDRLEMLRKRGHNTIYQVINDVWKELKDVKHLVNGMNDMLVRPHFTIDCESLTLSDRETLERSSGVITPFKVPESWLDEQDAESLSKQASAYDDVPNRIFPVKTPQYIKDDEKIRNQGDLLFRSLELLRHVKSSRRWNGGFFTNINELIEEIERELEEDANK